MIDQYIAWVIVAFVLWLLVRHWPPTPPPAQESRAFTTVSVPRQPANPQSLGHFVRECSTTTPEAIERAFAEYGDED